MKYRYYHCHEKRNVSAYDQRFHILQNGNYKIIKHIHQDICINFHHKIFSLKQARSLVSACAVSNYFPIFDLYYCVHVKAEVLSNLRPIPILALVQSTSSSCEFCGKLALAYLFDQPQTFSLLKSHSSELACCTSRKDKNKRITNLVNQTMLRFTMKFHGSIFLYAAQNISRSFPKQSEYHKWT